MPSRTASTGHVDTGMRRGPSAPTSRHGLAPTSRRRDDRQAVRGVHDSSPRHRPKLAARAPPSSTAASTSACSRGPPRASSCCSSTARTTPRPSRVVRLDPATNRTYHYWHVFVPGRAAGAALRLPRRGAVGPARGLRFDPAKVLLDPYGRGVVVPKNYDREAARRAGRQRRDGDEERRRRSGRVRLGGRRPAAPALRAHHHLRDARPRLHAPPELRRRREDPRHLRRPDREDSVSPGARHHRGRAAAGVPVRRPGLPAGQGQLLGLRAGLVLRAAPGLQLAAGSARPGRRVPRHGQGTAPGGHRGHSRRGLQPHRRGRPRPGRRSASAASTTRPTTSSKRAARATPTTPAAATRSTPTTRSSAA